MEICIQQINDFFIYAFICGAIAVCRVYFSPQELKLKVKDAGYDLFTFYCLLFVLGFVIVPLWIVDEILKLFDFELL